MRRAIIQVATMAASVGIPYLADRPSALYALCNDGSLWATNEGHAWARVQDVPQPLPLDEVPS